MVYTADDNDDDGQVNFFIDYRLDFQFNDRHLKHLELMLAMIVKLHLHFIDYKLYGPAPTVF